MVTACQPPVALATTEQPTFATLAPTITPIVLPAFTQTITPSPTSTLSETNTPLPPTVTATRKPPTPTFTAMDVPPTLITLPTSTVTASKTPVVVAMQGFATNTPFGIISEVTQEAASEQGTVTPTPTVDIPKFVDHYLLERPIERSDDLEDYANRVYPYGGTQFGQFEVHLGVDMVNGRFTPILAAGDGTVYYAGDDLTTAYGPYEDYYGNLVIIEHDFLSPEGLPVYSLYGHLQAFEVGTGERVTVGQQIGTIGDAGIAFGPHLHFEVRVGNPQNYLTTRNPDLWIKPYFGFGTLVGHLSTTNSDESGITILVRSEGTNRETYTYGGDRVNSDPSWGENFTYGDLPEGDYEIVVSNKSGRVFFRERVAIEAGKTTFIEIKLEN